MTSTRTTETARGQGLGAPGTIVTPFSGKLTVGAFAQNVLNTTNLVRYSGVLMSQAFGTPRQALSTRRFECTPTLGF